MQKITVLLFLSLVVSSSIIFAQDGTRAMDYNARSIGRGGVSIGFFDNNELMITNPAGLSFLERRNIDLNSIFMITRPTFKNYVTTDAGTATSTELNDKEGYKTLYVLPSLSYTHKIPGSRFTFGAGVFTAGGMGAEYDLKNKLLTDGQGGYLEAKYRSRLFNLQGGLTGSYLITNQFSVGVSAHLVYSTLEMKNPFSMLPSIMQGDMGASYGHMTFGQHFSMPMDTVHMGLGYSELTSLADIKELRTLSYNFKFGLAYKVSDQFSVGASYSTKVPLKYTNGSANLDMSAQFADASKRETINLINKYHISPAQAQSLVLANYTALGIDITKGFTAQYDIDNDFSIPMFAGVGMKFSPSKRVRLGLDFEWINWSDSYNKMSLTLKNGDNSNINRLLGQGGSGQTNMSIDYPMNWKDAYIIKIGGEYDLSSKVMVRAGYSFGSNPIPAETQIAVIPGILVHHIAVGSSIYVTPNFLVNLALEYAPKNSVDVSQSIMAHEYDGSTLGVDNLLGHISLTYFLK